MFTCTKCKKELDDSQRAPKRPECKNCRDIYYMIWKAKNRERFKTYQADYHEKNKERRLAENRAYKEANQEKVDAYNKAYRDENREIINAWRRDNKDKIAPAAKAWKEENAERVLELQRAWTEKNRAHVYAANKRWREENAEGVRERRSARHAARMKDDPVYADKVRAMAKHCMAQRRVHKESRISKFFKDDILAFYGNCPDGYHVDHIMPLRPRKHASCGLHVPWNLQYLTPEENFGKNDKVPEEIA